MRGISGNNTIQGTVSFEKLVKKKNFVDKFILFLNSLMEIWRYQ